MGAGIKRALTRIAHEILERNKGLRCFVLIGIRSGGAFLAEGIAQQISISRGSRSGRSGDITLYRDDCSGQLPHQPVGKTDIPFSLEAKKVILVDDVPLYTGRTIRAAMDALMDFGRPIHSAGRG